MVLSAERLTIYLIMQINKLLKLPRLYFNKGLPVYLIFFITSRCNSQCKTCFYAHALNNQDKCKELDINEIQKIADNFNYLWQLTLSGGEPFLRDDIGQICKIFYKTNDTQIISIPTNCLLPDIIEKKSKVFLKECENTFFRYCLSLDALGKDNDKITGVEGSFDKFLETYQRLKYLQKKYRNFNIDISTVVSNFNQNNLTQVVDYVEKELDANNHFLSLVRGTPRESVAKEISLEKYDQAFKKILLSRRKSEDRPFSVVFRTIQDLARKNNFMMLKTGKPVTRCSAIKKLAVISEIGDVFACELTWKKLGSLRNVDYNIGNVIRSKETKQAYKTIEENRCFCTWECVNTLNIIYSPKMILKFSKDLFYNILSKRFN